MSLIFVSCFILFLFGDGGSLFCLVGHCGGSGCYCLLCYASLLPRKETGDRIESSFSQESEEVKVGEVEKVISTSFSKNINENYV